MKDYVVVYLSAGGMHYRFRVCANTAREARKICHECMGVKYADITEVYREDVFRG